MDRQKVYRPLLRLVFQSIVIVGAMIVLLWYASYFFQEGLKTGEDKAVKSQKVEIAKSSTIDTTVKQVAKKIVEKIPEVAPVTVVTEPSMEIVVDSSDSIMSEEDFARLNAARKKTAP